MSDAEAITAILFSPPIGRRIKPQPTVLTDRAAKQISEYISGERRDFDLPLKPSGTVFQWKIWSYLMKVSYGDTCTYKDIAKAMDNVKAIRLIVQASARNPLPIVVPCHRLIGSNGKLVGYCGGLGLKEKLLRLERSRLNG